MVFLTGRPSSKTRLDPGGTNGRYVPLFGYWFDNLTQDALIDLIGEHITQGGSHWIATINVHSLCRAERDPAYGAVLAAADIFAADGMPIVWMSRLRRKALAARLAGADLLVPLAHRAQREGWRIFLAGAAPGIAEGVANGLRRIAPGLQIAGTMSPPFMDYDELLNSETNHALIQAIREARPDVLLLAFGSPKQERWIEQHIRSGELEVPVSVGVGAAFDFQVGRQKRAPLQLQRLGLEWLYRIIRSPRRLAPRYAGDVFTFARLCLRELLGRSA